VEIWICTQPYNGVVLEGLPYIAGQVPYPLPAERIGDYDAIVPLEDLLEYHPEHRTRHALTLLAERMGMDVPADRRPDYVVRPWEIQGARDRWPEGSRRRVALQLAASDPVRCYPRTDELIYRLVRHGWQVVVMGDPRAQRLEHSFGPHELLNLLTERPAPTFRESVALLAQCDGLVGPDSALVHVAGALGLPAVGLYGPFPWQLRTAFYPTVRGVSGVGGCAGCAHHSRGAQWPANKPCAQSRRCEVLATIEPARVVALLEKQIEEQRRRPRELTAENAEGAEPKEVGA
jgi:ADP-heptose:LPS heptosyltransferase